MQNCIDACYAAVTACKVCLNQHLGEPEMKRCHQLCLDCIEVCRACASLCATNSNYQNELNSLCAQICKDCAAECAKFDSATCRECAETCKACAEKCEAMVK